MQKTAFSVFGRIYSLNWWGNLGESENHILEDPLCPKALDKSGARIFLVPLLASVRFSHPNTKQGKKTVSLEKNYRYILYLSTQGTLAREQGSTQGTLVREHVMNVSKWVREHARHVGTWAHKHARYVSMQDTLACEHVSTQFSWLDKMS